MSARRGSGAQIPQTPQGQAKICVQYKVSHSPRVEEKKAHSRHHEMQTERLTLRMELKHWPWQLPVGLRLCPSSSGPLG